EGLFRQAEDSYRKRDVARGRFWPEHLHKRAINLLRLGKPQEAEPLVREALPLFRKEFGDQSEPAAYVLDTLGVALLNQQRAEEARPVLDEALAICCAPQATTWRGKLTVLEDLALCHVRRGRFDEAAPLYRDALDIARRRSPNVPLA